MPAVTTPVIEAIPTFSLEDKFTLGAKIGEGRWSTVHRVLNRINGQMMALKILRHDFADSANCRTRFRRDAKALRLLDHPNIVRALDAGELDGRPYLTMELVDGVTLDVFLRERRSAVELLDVFVQVARGLQHAHARGILHRDLRAENVMVTSQGVAKLIDFGSAKFFTAAGELGPNAQLTLVAPLAYDPVRTAPEVVDGAEPTLAADVYAVGVMMAPFSRELTADVDGLVRRMIHPWPYIRPEIGAVLDALEQARGRARHHCIGFEVPAELRAPIGDLPRPDASVPTAPASSEAATITALLAIATQVANPPRRLTALVDDTRALVVAVEGLARRKQAAHASLAVAVEEQTALRHTPPTRRGAELRQELETDLEVLEAQASALAERLAQMRQALAEAMHGLAVELKRLPVSDLAPSLRAEVDAILRRSS